MRIRDIILGILTVGLVWTAFLIHMMKPEEKVPCDYTLFVKSANGRVSMIEGLTKGKCDVMLGMILDPPVTPEHIQLTPSENIMVNRTRAGHEIVWGRCFNGVEE